MIKKLKQTINISDLLTTGGIFTQIANIQNQPLTWLTPIALTLDKEYYLSHSGNKYISRLYDSLLKYEESGDVTSALSEIAKMILNKFSLKWDRLYLAINTNYKPLENYDMEEKETPDITKDRTVKQNTNITTEIKDMDADRKVNGFNSTTPVNAETNSTNGTTTVSGDGNDNVTSDIEKETGNRTLTRHGNIGVTTSQQMLQSEIDLRNNFNFTNQLMDDVDSMLCLLVY